MIDVDDDELDDDELDDDDDEEKVTSLFSLCFEATSIGHIRSANCNASFSLL